MKGYTKGGQRLTIADFQKYLHKLYGKANSRRQWDYLFGYLSRGTTYLCRNIERSAGLPLLPETGRPSVEPIHFIRPLSWLFAVGSRFGIDMQEALVRRFPGKCPYCLAQPCVCVRTKKMPVKWLEVYKAEQELSAQYDIFMLHDPFVNLQFVTDSLFEIYPNNEVVWYHAGPWHHFVKLMEEVGELHEAICQFEVKKKRIDAVACEIADVLAWLLGAWKILYQDRSIDDALISYYWNGCPVCSSFPCNCTDRQDRVAELVNVEALESIQKHISTLSEMLPQSTDTLSELIKSIETAAHTQSEPTAIKAVKQTASRLEEIKSTLSTVDDIGVRAGRIISMVMTIISKLPYLY